MAQVNVTGTVNDLTTHKPIENASVILSNSTIGNRTAADGSFTLKAVKAGQYDMVVSIVGYETFHLNLTVSNSNITIPLVELLPKSITLNEVVVKPDANWARNYDIFKAELLGDGPEGKQCKILNPDVVQLNYDNTERKLTASSYDFMEIENPALGYHIKYQLTNFIKDYANNMLYYEGFMLFEDIKTNSSGQKKKWKKAREKAYYGSLQHFLRATLRNQTTEEGFRVLQLIRKPNPERPPEDLIKSKINYFRKLIFTNNRMANDSISKWAKFNQMPKTVSYLVQNPPVNPGNLIAKTEQPGIYTLSYPDYLYVMYTKAHDDSSNNLSFHPLNIPNYAITIVSFSETKTLFDENGSVINPSSLMFEGNWGKSRVAGMLPVDYEPEPVEKRK
ncbi:carboxypeptidase-like regulatory domain-containing protein [Mucilaginibacter jinjuensis]|uniref:Carboxypeptidase-like regulatory domain-containing protein n=1 Tax=Mucilaginibacter jinjuensis TaxID=1176721 RepID=A0ABY7T5U0_9SPHI|nr:carboxypeptidase-like regulatory domain-containing protein [Mucilaginibacter jinjuensis]WCT11619.1 carboxypeptidase-like regulatory domain-containing protein [Mucilaginibacter jinjuensis]